MGLPSITLAVLSSERVAAVSSRRRITLASADFSASTTLARMAFISPGSTMSFTLQAQVDRFHRDVAVELQNAYEQGASAGPAH